MLAVSRGRHRLLHVRYLDQSKNLNKRKNSTLTLNRYHVRLSDKRSERATVMGVLGTKPARVLIVRQSCEATLHLTQMYQDDLYIVDSIYLVYE